LRITLLNTSGSVMHVRIGIHSMSFTMNPHSQCAGARKAKSNAKTYLGMSDD